MHVLKRNGDKETIYFDKITARLQNLSHGLSVDVHMVATKVIQGLFSGVRTSEIDTLAAETTAYMSSGNPDYGVFAARISVSNLHKMTHSSFSEAMEHLFASGHISQRVMDDVEALRGELDRAIVHDNDYTYDYFGLKMLEKSYLMKDKGVVVVERPQYTLMRQAVEFHGSDLASVLETYFAMSQKLFTHATPTIFNAGTNSPQMSSCFLLPMQSDSITGIYNTLGKCAQISKYAGGIGLSIHKVRGQGAFIKGTNGHSNGILPMLRVYDASARYVDQGGGKRKGSIAIYLEPWHADIEIFLEMRKNNGKEELRARDLFYALWIPDLFMHRVKQDLDWMLFCPNKCPGLSDVHSEVFETLYCRYEKEGRGRVVKARAIWNAIISSQMETGMPYMLYKDACNRKSNHQHLGTIQNSNLCCEIVQYSSSEEIAVCNLASINLTMFAHKDSGMDYAGVEKTVRIMVRNLNKIIDNNSYPVEEARVSNMRHRPIGVGVQGLADVFAILHLPFESDEAREMNRLIFEHIYFAACSESCLLAEKFGVYPSYEGSPMSKGLFQFDLWNVTPTLPGWTELRAKVAKHGMRNSLLTAPMPTASTSAILGSNEAFEAFTSNIYSRRVLAGDFVVINKYLVRDLQNLGLWNVDMKQHIVAERGSVQDIEAIPEHLRKVYKTVWEIKQRRILDMAADRGPYVDQSQSMNIHMEHASADKITAMHMHGWKLGLKTGLYYLRLKPKVDATPFTVDKRIKMDPSVCLLTSGSGCDSCGS